MISILINNNYYNYLIIQKSQSSEPREWGYNGSLSNIF